MLADRLLKAGIAPGTVVPTAGVAAASSLVGSTTPAWPCAAAVKSARAAVAQLMMEEERETWQRLPSCAPFVYDVSAPPYLYAGLRGVFSWQGRRAVLLVIALTSEDHPQR